MEHLEAGRMHRSPANQNRGGAGVSVKSWGAQTALSTQEETVRETVRRRAGFRGHAEEPGKGTAACLLGELGSVNSACAGSV